MSRVFHRFRERAVWVVFLLLPVVAASGISGMGICLCPDGAVAVEVGCDGGCRDGEDGAARSVPEGEEAVAGPGAEAAGDCQYLAFASHVLLQHLPRTGSAHPAKRAWFPACPAVHLGAAGPVALPGVAARQPPMSPARASPGLAALGTIILRI